MFLHLKTKCRFGTKSIFKCWKYPDAYFSKRISRFSAGIRLSCPTDGEKMQGYFSFLKSGRAYFWLLKKGRAHFWFLQKWEGGRYGSKCCYSILFLSAANYQTFNFWNHSNLFSWNKILCYLNSLPADYLMTYF